MASNPKRDTSDPQPEAKRLCHLEEKTEKIERCLAQLVQAITARKSSTLDQSPAVSDPGMASGVSDQSPPLSSAPANPVQASAPVQAAHQPSATVQAAPGSSASVLAAPLPSSSGQPFISPPAQSAAFLAQPASTASLPPSAAHHLYPLPFFCDPSYYGHYLQSAMKASRGQVAQPPPPSESVTPIPLSPVSSDQEDFSEEDEVVDCNPPALFSFAPSTKEREPSIPDPDSELASQGVVCQKLGSPAWNRVRYTESQRALQAGGVFQPLAIPSEFPHSNSSTGENLVRQELFLGTLTHGLLLQRRAFSSTMNTLVEKYPEVREELGSLFSDESVFKNVSDHLLQYVCGLIPAPPLPPISNSLLLRARRGKKSSSPQNLEPPGRVSLKVQTLQKPQRCSSPVNPPADSRIGAELVGGRLRRFVDAWIRLGAPAPLVRIVSGYAIPFSAKPPLVPLCSLQHLATPVSSAMSLHIQEMLETGVLKRLDSTTGFLSRLFLVPKGNGGTRPVLNLKGLNQFLSPKKFSLINHFRIPSFLQKGDYMISIDLSQAYFHVPIKTTHQRFLALSYNGDVLAMTCLPFGLATAPQAFASLSNWVASLLRSRGMRVVVYLDDFLLVNQDPRILEIQGKLAVSILGSLGWIVNLQKSSLSPAPVLQFLGIMWDPHLDRMWLPEDKQLTLGNILRTLLASKTWNLDSARSLLGYLSFASFVIPMGRLHSRRIQRQASLLRLGAPHLTPINPAVLPKLEWWLNALPLSSPIFPRQVQHFISTDASDLGWGSQVDSSFLSGLWSREQQNWHINKKEMFAVHQALSLNLPLLQSSVVMVQSDNQTVVSYLRRQGGTKSLSLLSEVEKIFLLSQDWRIHILAQFIPGAYNSVADSLSRSKSLPDWHLSRSATEQIFLKWGVPCIDLFASRVSAVVPKYVSLIALDQEAFFIDAFSVDWDFPLAWVFPPPAMIPRVLQHLNRARGRFIIIAPHWEKVFWRPDLASRALCSPFAIPDLPNHLTDMSTGRPPAQVDQLHLEAWLVQGGWKKPLPGTQPIDNSS
ncbi:hypothetical protein M8J77_010180 [Diaphorina citri]|nr:hypothetical protein M8J77_010180 [Diaphorina citri]